MLNLTYLNAPDVAALALTDDEILRAVEDGLRAQGEGRTVIEPRMHLAPGRDDAGPIDGHFNAVDPRFCIDRTHCRRDRQTRNDS